MWKPWKRGFAAPESSEITSDPKESAGARRYVVPQPRPTADILPSTNVFTGHHHLLRVPSGYTSSAKPRKGQRGWDEYASAVVNVG